MSQVHLVADLGNDAVFFAWAGSVAFLAVYLLLARGWRTEVGRALITLDTGLTLALGPSVIHRLFGLSLTSLLFSWYFVASIALVGAAAWWRVWLVVKVQLRGRHDATFRGRPTLPGAPDRRTHFEERHRLDLHLRFRIRHRRPHAPVRMGSRAC